ncbi:MAG: hypothetical protein ACRCTJ_02785, partial [Brevinema sp.]
TRENYLIIEKNNKYHSIVDFRENSLFWKGLKIHYHGGNEAYISYVENTPSKKNRYFKVDLSINQNIVNSTIDSHFEYNKEKNIHNSLQINNGKFLYFFVNNNKIQAIDPSGAIYTIRDVLEEAESVRFYKNNHANYIFSGLEKSNSTFEILRTDFSTKLTEVIIKEIKGSSPSIVQDHTRQYYISYINKDQKSIVISTKDFKTFYLIGKGYASSKSVKELQINILDNRPVIAFKDNSDMLNILTMKDDIKYLIPQLQYLDQYPQAKIELVPDKIKLNRSISIKGDNSTGIGLTYTWFVSSTDVTISDKNKHTVDISVKSTGTHRIGLIVVDVFGRSTTAIKNIIGI